jgi:hypothetical protein
LGGIIFDLYLSVEFGDPEHLLSDALKDCSDGVVGVATNALSAVSNYFNDELKTFDSFDCTEEVIEDVGGVIEIGLFVVFANIALD